MNRLQLAICKQEKQSVSVVIIPINNKRNALRGSHKDSMELVGSASHILVSS